MTLSCVGLIVGRDRSSYAQGFLDQVYQSQDYRLWPGSVGMVLKLRSCSQIGSWSINKDALGQLLGRGIGGTSGSPQASSQLKGDGRGIG